MLLGEINDRLGPQTTRLWNCGEQRVSLCSQLTKTTDFLMVNNPQRFEFNAPGIGLTAGIENFALRSTVRIVSIDSDTLPTMHLGFGKIQPSPEQFIGPLGPLERLTVLLGSCDVVNPKLSERNDGSIELRGKV